MTKYNVPHKYILCLLLFCVSTLSLFTFCPVEMGEKSYGYNLEGATQGNFVLSELMLMKVLEGVEHD